MLKEKLRRPHGGVRGFLFRDAVGAGPLTISADASVVPTGDCKEYLASGTVAKINRPRTSGCQDVGQNAHHHDSGK